jgi:hypothetical protein
LVTETADPEELGHAVVEALRGGSGLRASTLDWYERGGGLMPSAPSVVFKLWRIDHLFKSTATVGGRPRSDHPAKADAQRLAPR